MSVVLTNDAEVCRVLLSPTAHRDHGANGISELSGSSKH